MTVAERMLCYLERSSWIRKMFEKGAQLKALHGEENIFDFSLGNPNLPPPPSVYERLQELIGNPYPQMHGYMPNAGFPEVRAAVAQYLTREHGIEISLEHVIMTCGAAGALNVIMKTLLNPGDEVVVPSPYFVEYSFYADNHEGILKTVPTRSDFSLDLDALDAAIGVKTKIVLINSPNNPTGQVYDEDSLYQLGQLLEKKSAQCGHLIYLVSDEPYRRIVYDGTTVPSVFRYYPHTIVATSYSKELSLPGERIGYLAVHPECHNVSTLMEALILANRILGFINAPALMQRLVQDIVGQCVDVELYKAKRDLLAAGLREAGYEFFMPRGAFYLFPKTPIPDDVEFVRILQEERILAVPGVGFGAPGHFRLAYCVEDTVIEKSLPGFKRALERVD